MSAKMVDILDLSIEERIQIVQEIWDSIVAVPEAITLSEEQKRDLDRRLKAYHLNPESGSPWHEVRERILNRSGV